MSVRRLPRVTYCLAALCFAAPAYAGVDLPSGGKLETVDFERHVMGLPRPIVGKTVPRTVF